MQRRFPWIGLLGLWAIAVIAGCLILQSYAAAPGEAGHPPARWPKASAIPLDSARPTLLIFLHPLCPCSRASVDELSEILARCRNAVAAHAVIFPVGNAELDLGSRCGSTPLELPGVSIFTDNGGALARQFGVRTSGHVLLYDRLGRLLFSGGITPARGHRGDNFGSSSVLAELSGKAADRSSPVFGCPLSDLQPDRAPVRKGRQ